MGLVEHQSAAALIVARCAVVTVSDTRTLQSDRSGIRIGELLVAADHELVDRMIVRDDPEELVPLLELLLARNDIDAIVTTGGTGISPRDQTVPAIASLIDLPLPGFGELFRMLSFKEIGSAAMMSRALGGVARGRLLFALPGSTPAVELGMNELILPQLGHLVHELRK